MTVFRYNILAQYNQKIHWQCMLRHGRRKYRDSVFHHKILEQKILMSSKNTAMRNLKNSIIRGKVFFDTCHENTQKTNGTYMFRTKTTVNVSIVRNISLWFWVSFYLLFMQGLRPFTVANVTAAPHSITWPLVELWLAI